MIRVLVVDDSAIVRRVLSEALTSAGDIEVVGTAVDPYAAREKIAQLRPDVITLDIEMPRMDGLTFLEKLMAHHPLPVVVVSSLTPTSSSMALRALSLGAVGVVCKPGSQFSIQEVTREVVSQVRAASVAKIHTRPVAQSTQRTKASSGSMVTTKQIVAIGASTGGPPAIEQVLMALPTNCPGQPAELPGVRDGRGDRRRPSARARPAEGRRDQPFLPPPRSSRGCSRPSASCSS